MKYLLLFLLAMPLASNAQVGNDKLLDELMKLTANFPPDIRSAYQQYFVNDPGHFDSLQQKMIDEFPALAEKAKRRSMVLNGLAGINEPGSMDHLINFDAALNNHKIKQSDKMNAIDRKYNLSFKKFYGNKELYNSNGFVNVWDSVYKSRLPVLRQYRDDLIKLIKEDMAYLKTRESLLKDETKRVQYIEAEASILGKIIALKNALYKVLMDDGAKQVEYCKKYLQECK